MRLFKLAGSGLLLIALLNQHVLIAQDLGIPAITYPADNQNVHLQYTYQIEFILKNYGTAAVPKGTLINFDLLLDKTFYQSYNLTLNNNPINAGDSLIVTIPALTLSTIQPTIEVCVVTRLGIDPNPMNDTSCNVFLFSIDNNVDLEPKFLDIVHPDRDTLLAPGDVIYRIEGYILNSGTVTLPRDYNIDVEYSMYGIKKTIKVKTVKGFAPNENFIANMLSFPQVQSEEGAFDICFRVLNADDVNASNNDYCRTFIVKDFTGIDGMSGNRIRSFTSSGDIIIESGGDTGPVHIQLFNLQGQEVYSGTVLRTTAYEQLRIQPGPVVPGFYVLQVRDLTSATVHRNKLLFE